MPFAYAVYWGVHALLVLWLSQWVSSRFGWSMLKSMIVLAIPVNYVWDFVVEGTATAMGWWTYDPGIGPVLEWDSGGRITLLWTIGIMCTWPNLIAYWAGKPPIRGLNHLERFVGLDRFTRAQSACTRTGFGDRVRRSLAVTTPPATADQDAGVRRLPQLRGDHPALEIRTDATRRVVRGLPGHLLRLPGRPPSHPARGARAPTVPTFPNRERPVVTDSPDFKRRNMKDMPAEFFLPPPTKAGLWRETITLAVGCYAFIFVLAVIVALTQGIVIRV